MYLRSSVKPLVLMRHGAHGVLLGCRLPRPMWAAGLSAAGSVLPASGGTAGVVIERHYRSTPTTILMGTVAGFDLTGFMGKYFK